MLVSDHVTEYVLGKVLSRLQANYQKLSFQYAGVDIQSQEAYDLVSRGMVRPQGLSQAIFFLLKCVHLRRPYFTLEVHCLGETEFQLRAFIQELGLMLKTTACSTQIRKVWREEESTAAKSCL